jgi:hypothetical protein
MISPFLTSSVEIQQPIVKVKFDGRGKMKEKEREMKKRLALFVFAKPMSNIGMNHCFSRESENNLAIPKQGFPGHPKCMIVLFLAEKDDSIPALISTYLT